MTMDLKEKNVIVTGGCRGIGHAITRELLRREVRAVGLFDIQNSNIVEESLRKEFPKASIDFYQTDVCHKNEIKRSFEEFVKKHQFVDIVVVNAGIYNELDPRKTVEVNVIGTINTIEVAVEQMSCRFGRKGRGGSIVTTASIAAFFFTPISAAYGASKHAVMAYTLSKSKDLDDGINFFTVCPGSTNTEMSAIFKDLIKPDYQSLIAKFALVNKQSADELAKEYVDIIEINRNGSAWIVEKGEKRLVKPMELYFTDQ